MLPALLIVGAVLAVTVFVVSMLRGWGKGVERTEAVLHDPATATLAYDVPPGRDPAAFMTALAHAGYTAVEDHPGRLVVACPQEGDEAAVRELLAGI